MAKVQRCPSKLTCQGRISLIIERARKTIVSRLELWVSPAQVGKYGARKFIFNKCGRYARVTKRKTL